MYRSALSVVVPSVVALALWGGEGQAQIKASERGGVHQTVDGTTVTVDYSRPRARGRSPIFGGVVHWGHIWTPGADWATTIEVDKPVRIQGQEVPVGKYSMWFVVQDAKEWELWLDPEHRKFHLPEPERTEEQIYLTADVYQQPSFTEVLTWSFNSISLSGMTLALEWGNAYVPLEVQVEPTVQFTTAPEIAAPMAGSFFMEATRGEWFDRDVEIWYDSSSSMLIGRFSARRLEDGSHASFSDPDDDDAPLDIALFPETDEWFKLGFLRNGEIWSVSNITLEFEIEDGVAQSVTVVGRNDRELATARRIE